MKKMLKPLSLVLLASLAAAGCAQDLEDIDQVQNNVTQKAELKGEFYFRSTVVEAPYASLGFFVGNQNYHMERGVFEIQEKTLYFYRTYEHVIGGETYGAAPDVDTPLYQTDDDGELVLDANGKAQPVTFQKRVGNEIVTVQRFVYRGSPIFAFPILSHFDVKRNYNPLTGEETNVIVENTSDREWWERESMRVAWGTTKVGHWDENILAGAVMGEFYDEQFDEAPVKVYNEDGTLDYFDYTVRKTLEAPVVWYGAQGFDYIPACWYNPWFIGQVAECNSERIQFRQAFQRVKRSDYVAWDYDDTHLKKFGYYRLERAQYDPTRGTTFSGVSRRIRRFRIWEEYKVNKGAACEAVGGDVYAGCDEGSVCEPFSDGSFCVAEDANDRLDYANMTAKPIVWYLSEEFPRELVPETIVLGEHWDEPFTDVVATRKGAAPDHAMFIVCENNLAEATKAMEMYGLDITNPDDVAKAQTDKVLAGIDGHCVDMENAKRNGDLRYSQIHSVNDPTSVGLYGYGPSSADPLTGEILSANSYMYTPAMRRGANAAMLAIELQTGIRNFWETIYANQVREGMSKKALGRATGGLKNHTLASAQALAGGLVAPEVSQRIAEFGVERMDPNWAENRMAMLAHNAPSLAKMFVTDDVKMIHRDPSLGIDTGETSEELVDRLGMHTWAHHRGHSSKRNDYLEKAAENGCKFYEEFADNAILGLAREFGHEMNDRVCDAARSASNTVFDFTAFDEVLGACTNEGAWDEDGLQLCSKITVDAAGTEGLFWTNPCQVGKLKAQLSQELARLEQQNDYFLNNDYFPADPVYTDTKHEVVQNSQMALIEAIDEVREDLIQRLWKRIYLGVAEHEIGHSIGLRHNFEGSTDAMNFGEKYWNLKGQFDASGQFNAFDLFTNETTHQAENSLRQLQSASVMDYSAKFNDRFEGVGYYDRAAVRFGYGGLVEVFDETPDLATFAPYLADPAENDPTNQPIIADFSSNKLETLFKRVHYTNIPELFGSIDGVYKRSFVPASSVNDDGVTADGKHEVPYRFCSDELAGRLPTCERWDSGVDSFEMVRNAIQDYEQYWPIWGHWHDSILFFPDMYYSRIVRIFSTVKHHMQWWVADYQRYNRGDWWEQNFGQAWHLDPNGGLAGAVAVSDSVNMMGASFGRPEPGLHGFRGARNVWEPVPFQDNTLYTNTELIHQNNCEARPLYPAWDYSGYLPLATRGGAIYERLAAFQALADPSTHFLAVDYQSGTSGGSGVQTGIEQYYISYYSLFPQQVTNLFGSILANKTDGWGWYMVLDDEGRPDHCARRVIVGPDAQTPTETEGADWWAFNPEPEYTFPTTRFRLPMLAAYYGLGLLLNGYDDSFTDVSRVFVDGHMSAITPNDDAEVVSFTDPLSGKTYTALKSDYADGVFHPAVHMIEQMKAEFGEYPSLQALQEDYNYSDYQFVLDKLELLRGMNMAYDYNL